ncbi:MAG: hypothetical protein LBM17_07805 [Candidatus Accumulibacter sp.]|jgi:hypothetical protein|nr:hypothetical protein [Accumulibacter sp.]
MNEAILFHLDNRWILFADGAARVVEEYPRLDAPTIVVTDFGGALCGVAPVGAQSGYAEALISRRLRDEGMIDGEAKVVIHHSVKSSGDFQAFYTAVPVDAWQRMQAWARIQEEACLLVPLAAVMYRLLPRGEAGVFFRHGRNIALLFSRKSGLIYSFVLSLGDDAEDLLSAVRTLAGRIPDHSFDPARLTMSLTWYSLLESGASNESNDPDEDEKLCAAFSEASGLRVVRAPVEACGGIRVAMSAIRSVLSERIAVNPAAARFDYFAEKHLRHAALCAGLAALAFLIGGGVSLWQAGSIGARSEQNRNEARAIEQRLQGGRKLASPGRAFYATRDLVDLVANAQAGIDPYVFLRNLRAASGDKVKLLRVSMGKEIVVEGWVDQTGGDDTPLAGFVTQLRQMGFSLEAIDVPSAENTHRSGFFAYRLTEVSKRGESQ